MTDECAVLLTAQNMRDIFGVSMQTVHRWNTAKAGRGRLPEPDLRLDEKPVWFEATIREWAASRPKHPLFFNEEVFKRICAQQNGARA